jgi:hypothetical protein
MELRVSRVVRSLASVSTDSAAPRAEYSDHQLNLLLTGTHGGWGTRIFKVLSLAKSGNVLLIIHIFILNHQSLKIMKRKKLRF